MKAIADSYFNCADCEDLIEPGDPITRVVGVGTVCDDCLVRRDEVEEQDFGYWESGDYG